MAAALRSLRVVPTCALYLHESVEPERARRVARQLWQLGCLQHPVLATPLAGRWLVLDGHHRVAALRAAGIGAVLVQHVELDESVRIGSWAHELPRPVAVPPADRAAGPRVARVVTASGVTEVHSAGIDLRSRVVTMWQLAGRYGEGPYRRVTRHEAWSRGASCRIEYEPLSANDCLLLVELGLALPAGVTRFQVSGRILNVRVPLEQLAAAGRDPQAADRLVERLHSAPGRLYPEPVYLVEEAA